MELDRDIQKIDEAIQLYSDLSQTKYLCNSGQMTARQSNPTLKQFNDLDFTFESFKRPDQKKFQSP